MVFKELTRPAKSHLSFIGNWVKKPTTTGAVVPSGGVLAEKMASFVDPNGGPILELGPGTGSVTRALLRRGVPPLKIIALEFDDDFCAHFDLHFPEVRLIQGDAYRLSETLARQLGVVPKLGAVVSSLPLLNRPTSDRERVLDDCLSHLEEGAPFIQFSYGLWEPIQPPQNVSIECSGWIWRNIPPARVYVYR